MNVDAIYIDGKPIKLDLKKMAVGPVISLSKLSDEERKHLGFSIWTVFKDPSDYPNCFVARMFVVHEYSGHEQMIRPTNECVITESLNNIDELFDRMGKAKLDRDPLDDSKILYHYI